ncbi:MAG: hypothetical protein HYZ28_16505 [Myxococcales bacterium]|nr:hypothetical protein [Myxococcales bacterium]
MKSADPRALLDALLSGAELAFPPETTGKARTLAQAEEPPAAEVASLPEPLALAVLESQIRQRRSALAEALAESGSKPLAKAAKRALYQLRSLGLELPERRADRPPQPQPAPETREEFPFLLSPVTGTGERALLAARPRRGGGLEVLQIVFDDEQGIRELSAAEVGRGALRKLLKEIRSKDGQHHLEVSAAEAREALGAAWAKNLASRTPLPKEAEEDLRHLGVQPNERALALPLPEEGDAGLALEGHQLHGQPELTSWLPPEKQLRVLSQRLEEVTASPLQLTPEQKEEQLFQKVRATAEEFFTPEAKRLYAGRLWAMASYFERTGRPGPGAIARAEARRLFHLSPGISRFSEFLFEKVLILARRARAGQAMPGMGERLEEPRPAPKERRSPGGLIIP